MSLQEQNIPISFSKGLNTKTDPKQTMQGQLLALSNGVFTRVNAINQDPGYLPVPQPIYNSTNSIAAGNSLATFNDQLILTDSQFLYAFSEITQTWAQVPTKVANSVSSQAIGANAIGNTNIGIAKNVAGLEFYTYARLASSVNQPTAINYIIYDPLSETSLYNNSFSIAGVGSSQVYFSAVTFGTTFTGFFWTNALDTLRYTNISSISPPQTVTNTTLLSGVVQPPDIIQTSTNIYILSWNATTLTLTEYSPTLTIVNTVAVTTGTAFAPSLVRDPATGNLYVSWYDSINVNTSVFTSTLGVVHTPAVTFVNPMTVSAISGVVLNSTTLYLYIQTASGVTAVDTGNIYDTHVVSVPTSTLTPVQVVETMIGCYIATKAYIFNSLPTIGLGFFEYNTASGSSVALLEQSVYVTIQQTIPNSNYNLNTNYTQINKYSEGTAGAPLTPLGVPAYPNQVLSLSNSNVVIPYLFNNSLDINSDNSVNIYNVQRLNDVLGTHTRSVSLGNNLNSTGGVLTVFDGTGIAESGFTIFPWQTIAVFSSQITIGSNQGLTGGQTYSYVATYEWIDKYGNLHRSSPGAASTGVAAANATGHASTGTVTVNKTSLSEEYKIFDIQIVLWRTAGNGSIFYRLSSQSNTIQGSPTGYVTFTDTTPDSDILDSTQLYTTGGEVDNIAPPPTDIIFPYKNRIIAIQADNPYVWWYSKQVIQGFPVEFSDLFTSNIDMTGGPISAGNTMDDKLIFFKDSTIFYVIGDGPAPNGTSNDFSYPQVITSDVGCTNQDSIIVIPIGLMFQSTDKGIYLLDRTLQVSYVGAPVEAFNNIPVTSAQLLPNTTQVRFTLNNGTILIYDYAVQQWSTHTTLTFMDSTIYKQLHTGLQANGQVLEQTQGQWMDIATPNPLSLTTGWFEFAQFQGYQRVKEFLLMLTSTNATSLQIQIFNDFDTTPIQTDLIEIPANTTRQQYRIFPAFQKAQSMQIVITEIPTGAQAGGLLLSGVAFTMAMKRGLNKLPAVQAYG